MLYGDALQEIVTGLDNAGLRATTEVSELQLPGALVVPGPISFEYLDHENYTANVEVYLLTADHGSVNSMNELQELLANFHTVFDALEAEPLSLNLPNISQNPIPGLLINLQATITKD